MLPKIVVWYISFCLSDVIVSGNSSWQVDIIRHKFTNFLISLAAIAFFSFKKRDTAIKSVQNVKINHNSDSIAVEKRYLCRELQSLPLSTLIIKK